MKKLPQIFIVLILISSLSGCVALRLAKKLKALKAQIEMYKTAFQNKDYEQLMEFTYPAIADKMGDDAVNKLKNSMNTLTSRGNLEGLNFTEPDEIISKDGKLGAMITQTLMVKVPGGKLETKIPLMAVSEDGGKKWFFINTSKSDVTSMFPKLTDGMNIPSFGAPKFIRN